MIVDPMNVPEIDVTCRLVYKVQRSFSLCISSLLCVAGLASFFRGCHLGGQLNEHWQTSGRHIFIWGGHCPTRATARPFKVMLH